jgi:carboxymethylenebutenolidase
MSELSAQQTRLAQLWEEHMRHEFQTCSTEETLATMVDDSYVNHVPVMTGGVGHAELRQFYATHFIPKMPPDMRDRRGVIGPLRRRLSRLHSLRPGAPLA